MPAYPFLCLPLSHASHARQHPTHAFVQRAEKKGEGMDKTHKQIKQESQLEANGLENVADHSMTCLSTALTT